MKRKLEFENYKSCLEASQLENEITIQSKIKLIQTGFEKNHKEFIKIIIIKIMQRFKSEKHSAFTEEINKIALSSNNDKRIQSIDSIKTHAFGTRKDLLSEKEMLKCNNIIKRKERD